MTTIEQVIKLITSKTMKQPKIKAVKGWADRTEKCCSSCKETKPLDQFYREYSRVDGRSIYCGECLRGKSKHRDWKRYMARVRQIHPVQQKAREKLQDAVRRGQITRKSCLFCANENSQAHHLLYEFWSIVIWLCQTHHTAVHQQSKFITPIIKNPVRLGKKKKK